MPFKKRHLGTEIALILSLGLLLTAISSTAQAQLVQVSCRANDSGDGWICEENPTPGSTNTVPTTTRPLNNTEVGARIGEIDAANENRQETPATSHPQPTQASQQADEPYGSRTIDRANCAQSYPDHPTL